MNAHPSVSRAALETQRLSVWSTVRRFPQPVWCLFAGMFINRFGTFVIPFLVLHVTRLGYSPREGGLALGAYGLGHLAASAIGGHLADTMGRRRSIIASMACGALTMILLSQAHTLFWLVTLAFLNGATGEFYRPASSALLADLVAPENRVTAFAAYRFAMNAGFACGSSVAGFLAQHDYLWLFLGDASTSLIYGLLAFFLLPGDCAQAAKPRMPWSHAAASLRQSWRTAVGDRRFVRLMVATFAAALVFVQLLSTLGLSMRAAGLPDSVYGLVLSLNGLLIVFFEIPLTALSQRGLPPVMIGTGFTLIGLGSGLYAWATQGWHYALGMAVFTSGEMLSMPVAMAYVTTLAPETMRGRYLGLYGLTWAAALACGPNLGSWAFSISPAGLWLGCTVLAFGAATLIARPLPAAE